jgi:hypothetical protein
LAKNFAEDIKGIMEPAAAGRSARAATGALKRRVAIAIIGRPFFRVLEGLVGFGNFLKRFLCLFIAGIFIRMELHGLLVIGLFQFILVSVFLDAE